MDSVDWQKGSLRNTRDGGAFLRRTAAPIKRRRMNERELRSFAAYVKFAAPEPDILRIVGEESRHNRTNRLTLQQINGIIRRARARKRARKDRGQSAK